MFREGITPQRPEHVVAQRATEMATKRATTLRVNPPSVRHAAQRLLEYKAGLRDRENEAGMDEIASFGEWLRRRRKALDLTQAALADRAGCVPGTIKSIEADTRRSSRQ